jgi:hypothetical protein
MADPLPPTATSESSSAFTVALAFPTLRLTFRSLGIKATPPQYPFGLKPEHQTKHLDVLAVLPPDWRYFNPTCIPHK